MSDAYVIEYEGTTAGIAVSERRGFRFHASDPSCQPLDRKAFPTLIAMRKAIAERLTRLGKTETTPARTAA